MSLTIPYSTRLVSYTLTSGQTVMSWPYPLLYAADIVVKLRRANAETVLTPTADYTVTIASDQASAVVTLTSPAASGDIVAIAGKRNPERITQYTGNTAFKPDFINDDFNLLTMQQQELRRDLDLAVTSTVTDPSGSLDAKNRRLTNVSDPVSQQDAVTLNWALNVFASTLQADVTQANADAAQTAADRVQTGADRVATGADRVQTGLDRTATTAASTAATGAAASLSTALASFRQVFLGELSSDPTVDGNGNALTVGAEYFNTTTNKFRTVTGLSPLTWSDKDASAVQQANNAALSATSAASSAATATTQATSAATYATNAAASATSASTSAATATTQAASAVTSATNAAASATSASSSAATATNQATGSATSATNAAASATSASSSAATATNQASAAALSSTSAAASASSAAGLRPYDYDRVIAPVRPILPTAISTGTCVKNADRSFTLGVSSQAFFDIALTAAQIAAASVYIEAKILSALSGSTFVAATYEQRSGTVGSGASVVAAASFAIETNRLIKRALALNAATTFIRVVLQNNASTTTVFTAPAVTLNEPAEVTADGNLAALNLVNLDATDALPNIWPNVPTVSAVSGSVATRSGRSITFPAGAQNLIQLNATGLAASDTVSVMFQLSAPVSVLRLYPSIPGVANGTITIAQDLGNGWYGALGISCSVGGSAATAVIVDVQTITQNGYTAAATTLSTPWMAKNATAFTSKITASAATTAAVSALLFGVAYVDGINGSDSSGIGTRDAPYATLTKAIGTGAKRIFLRANGVNRIGTAGSLNDVITITSSDVLEVSAYREAADTNTRAQLWGSINVPAASWTAVGGSYPNLYYYPLAYDPNSFIFEINATGDATRISYLAPTITNTGASSFYAPDLATCNGGPKIEAVGASATSTTSTTTLTPVTGTLTLTTAHWSNVIYAWGRVRAYSAANSAIYMEGSVTRWDDFTLVLNVDQIGTASSASDWVIVPVGSGALWYGAGPSGTGLYLYPINGSLTGKSYEIPCSNRLFNLNNVTSVRFCDIEMKYSGGKAISSVNCTLTTQNCLIGWTGHSSTADGSGVYAAYGTYVSEGDIFENTGNCGVAGYFNNIMIATNSTFIRNFRNGCAQHAGTNAAPLHGRFSGCRFIDNPKDGHISIGAGTFRLDGCLARNNGIDMGLDYTGTSGSMLGTYEMTNCQSDLTQFNGNTGQPSTNITARLRGTKGTKVDYNFATVEIDGYRGIGNGTTAGNINQAGLKAGAGLCNMRDFFIGRTLYGIMINHASAVVNARSGAIVRPAASNAPVLNSTTGVITLSSAAPVNVYTGSAAGTAWATATSYTAGAMVTSGGSVYLCVLSHTSSSSIDTTKFQLVKNFDMVV